MNIIVISFCVYTAFIVLVGLWSARKARKSDVDYFLAGRNLNPWVAALSASASSESGWVTFGLVGLAYGSGIAGYWLIPGTIIGFLFNWLVIAGRMRARAGAIDALTLPDFFSKHFDEAKPVLRIIAVVVIAVAMTMYVAAQFAAAGKAFEQTFNVTYLAGVLIGTGIVLAYTVLGGFRAACWTDFLQAFIMVGALVVFPVYLIATTGGFDFVQNQLADVDDGALLRFMPEKAPTAALIGFLLGSGALGLNFGYPGQPHVLVRFMALRDPKDARIGAIVASTWLLLVIGGAVTIGVFARAMVESGDLTQIADKELALVLSAKHLLHGTISGFVLAAILAAICSTADSQLVVAGSAVASDIYTKLIRRSKGNNNTTINRVTIFMLGAISMLLVVRKDVEIYKFVTEYGWAVLGASFGPQLILILLWRKASYAGCVAGMITGFIVAIGWTLLTNTLEKGHVLTHIYNLPLAFMSALVMNALVSVLMPSRVAGTP